MNNVALTLENCNAIQSKRSNLLMTNRGLREFSAIVWDYVTTLPANSKYFTTWRDDAEKVRSNYMAVVKEMVHGKISERHNVSDTAETFVNNFSTAVYELVKTANACTNFSLGSSFSNEQKEAVERLVDSRIAILPGGKNDSLPDISFVSCDKLATSEAICQRASESVDTAFGDAIFFGLFVLVAISIAVMFYVQKRRRAKMEQNANKISEVIVEEDEKLPLQ